LHSERRQASGHVLAACLCLLSALGCGPALGHPDLLSQIEVLDAQIAEQPGDAGLLVQRGDLYRRHGDFTAASRDFSAARVIDPSFSEHDFYSGRLALEMGDQQTALTQLGQYLQQNPQHAAAWTLHGDAQLALGQPLAAAGDYARAISTSAHPSPTLFVQQARALDAAGQDHQEAALQVVDQGLERFPREVSLLGTGTDIALSLGQFEKAQGYLEVLPPSIRALPQWQSREARVAAARAQARPQ
jgi:tetratricopeptide (TPR) repeat protein